MKRFMRFFLIVATISAVIFTGCSTPDYQLSTSVVPSGGGTISPSVGTFKGGSDVVLVASPSQYYQFVGWAGDASGDTNPLTVNMNSNKQIVAQFSRITYSVEMNTMPADGGTVNPTSGTYEAGTQLTLNATPNDGYRFNNWSGDITGGSNTMALLVNSNKNLTANFIKTYKLNINYSPDVGAIVNQASGVYDAGEKVTLSAKPSICPYGFDHWSGADNDNLNPTTVTMDADKSVTLYFKKLTASQPVTDSKTIWGGGSTHVGIEVNKFDWVQGEFWGPYFSAVLQDPNGKTIKTLGANFTFNAEIPGRYLVVLHNTNTMISAAYSLTYTIYHR